MSSAEIGGRNWQSLARPGASLLTIVFSLCVVIVLLAGWIKREDEDIDPGSGLGYWLGIAGLSMMIALLYYSYRKRQKHGTGIGTIPGWFRLHMLLGILGPMLVVFHSNFQFGALNSNVAMVSMLTVAGSGLVGRYIYGRIHLGLNGRKIVAEEVSANLEALRKSFAQQTSLSAPVFDELDAFGRKIMTRPTSTTLATLYFGGIQVVRASVLRFRLRRKIKRLVYVDGRMRGLPRGERRLRLAELNEFLDVYLNAVLKVAELRFFDRLFGLWHMLHLPLFFVMVMTVVVHVWAVHRY